jgi:hypothetical protein
MNQASTFSIDSASSRLGKAFLAEHADESEIRNAVCALVDAAKPLGWPVERLIVEVKRLAEVENGFLFRARLSRQARREAEAVLERAVTWCIEHYFWTPPAS